MSIPRLNREWERMRLKYGIAASPPGLDRLLLSSRRRQARLRHLHARHEEIKQEIDVLENEVDGIDKALRHYLNDVIATARLEHGNPWSPVPVLGFRVWTIRDLGFHGYWRKWEHRSLTAECGTSTNRDDLPHTNGECRNPPCGIYAAKDASTLMGAHSSVDIKDLAVGLVGMTGKVVEHEKGYRAEQVTVLALAFPRGIVLHTTDDPDEIELLFQGVGMRNRPTVDGDDANAPDRRGFTQGMIAYVEKQRERKERWILESPNEL